MGQYWIPVNLDKREFVHPHRLGAGLKLWEQLASGVGTGTALIALCAAMPEARGCGDLGKTHIEGEKVVGRWAGDRIALVGDYAERGDLPEGDNADLIYSLCTTQSEVEEYADWLANEGREYEAKRLRKLKPLRDISDLVCSVIESELNGKFEGEGWRDFVRDGRILMTERHSEPSGAV